MELLRSFKNTGPVQWVMNNVRGVVYPWVWNAWEADKMFDEYNIYLGNLESACDREAMRKKNIHRVVTAVYDLSPIFPNDPDLLYLKVPVIDKPTADIKKHFDRAIDFIHEGVTGKHEGKGVLVHCVYGVSRSSTLICAYLIKKHHLTVKQAVTYVKQRRSKANPNKGFLEQLEELYSKEEVVINWDLPDH